MGVASHFARLRLLDPERYQSLERFQAEEQGYVAVAEAIDALELETLDAQARDRLGAVVDDADSQALVALLANPESDADQ
ncbi:hypothetical protein, partial [Salmonella enterica]